MAGWNVVLDPAAVAVNRTELPINQDPIRIDQKGIDWGDAAVNAFMADQQYGSAVVDHTVPNRTVTIPVFIGSGEYDSEFDALVAHEAARSQLQQKIARIQAESGWLLRQRDGGPPMYADIQKATLNLNDVLGETGAIEVGTITLECLPDFYGDEITLDTISATDATATVLQQAGEDAIIEGDYPARCRIIVTNSSTQPQWGVLWGMRARHYDPAATASLIYQAEDLTVEAGASIVVDALASGGHAVQAPTLSSTWAQIIRLQLPTDSFTHLGSYRVWARAIADAVSSQAIRLEWSPGAAFVPLINDSVAVIANTDYQLCDLGEIRIDRSPIGTTQWDGFITAQDPGGRTVLIDEIFLQPIDDTGGRTVDPNGTDGLGLISPSGGNVEIRTEGTYRELTTGIYFKWGAPIGDLPRLPTSGLEARPVELFVKMTRSNLDDVFDALDDFDVQVTYRPCYLSRI